ncbi:carboxylating nicotinate-nucleotide diphosphorylase [Desulfurivibrio alkaliphilus]|uniref:Probable nicotinate-nucleotide pyrophosphorylase [carboxylating] n=1 Tax=Desulfurivibrio alkaliphilus (strain DSM 19089 / UNIQEM U267 / AHT2) TaxID=589865 RepID=D6Z1U7_DESAT|nr:carboxylating nicotinate-nucleotide diphosphorylase [Desulfurivibrio alkaliphilus]ADH85522.1 nicotinate-nucleotide pyrophosphorylase [Desulfurivibrio alkaliphilus AHT 2]
MERDSQDHGLFKNPDLHRSLRSFLDEDLGRGDITGEAIFDRKSSGTAVFIAKEAMVLAGVEQLAPLIFQMVNRETSCHPTADGRRVEAGEVIFKVSGPMRDLLAAERLALNLCQRLSGIATYTADFVAAVAGYPAKIMDTRKTTPGLRLLERYAVRAGGGVNHRFNLNDGILIKDNHIAAAGSIARAVARVREYNGPDLAVEVECETLAQVEEAMAVGVEIIMLDNMSPALMTRAVSMIGKQAITEASGGVSLANVREIAACGVDRISIGALTHSAPAKDISMEMVNTGNPA